MVDDYYDAKLALDRETGNVVAGASARVYASADTTFTTPLAITDMVGVPMPMLVAGPTGIFPQFKVVSGAKSVLAKAGTLITPLTSMFGMRGEPGIGLQDPAALPDGMTPITVGGEWGVAPAGSGTGDDGREVELRKALGEIQWRYVGDPTWMTLVSLAELAGADGREVSLQVSATHIQWRLGTNAWADLISIADITGPPGSGSGGGGATNGEVAAFVSGAGATRTAVDARVTAGITGKADLVGGVIPTNQLPPLAINETFTAATQAAMLALTAQRGDMAIRTDNGRTYVLAVDAPGTLANWKEVLAAGQVTSVAGRTGVVALTKADVALGNVDNTSDASKPVSTPQAEAIAAKLSANEVSAALTGVTDTSVPRRVAGRLKAETAVDGDDLVNFAQLQLLLAEFAAFVFVTTGDEPRPPREFVIWMDMREGEVSAPSEMGASDVRFRPGSVAPAPTPPAITTAALSSLTQAVAFSQALAASGTTPITWAVTGGTIPAGLALSTGGLLSGTPTGSGAYSFTVTATNTAGSDPQLFTGTIGTTAVAPVITTTTLTALKQGTAFSQTLAATGSTPITFAVTTGTLPAGLALSTAGLLSGTPTAPGAYSFTVTATNSAGSDPHAYTGTVAASGGTARHVLPDNYGTPVAGTDGGGALYSSNRFYSTGAVSFRALGARFFVPPTATGAFLTEQLTFHLYAENWTGADLLMAPYATPAQSKVHAGPRVAGTWIEVLFDAPTTFLAAATTGTGPDVATIAMRSTSGNYYGSQATKIGPDWIASINSDGVGFAEADLLNGGNSILTNGTTRATWYGLDLIYEVV